MQYIKAVRYIPLGASSDIRWGVGKIFNLEDCSSQEMIESARSQRQQDSSFDRGSRYIRA